MSSDLTSAGGGGGGITALTGDVTASGTGSQAATIPTSVISTFMRTVTDDADAAAARATLGVPTILTAVTNAQFDAFTTTLATVTGLSVPLAVGTWLVAASLPIVTNGVDGYGVSIGGSATLSASLEFMLFDYGLPGLEAAGMYDPLSSFTGAATNGCVKISGSVVVTVAGTLTITFAQASPGGPATPSTVLAGAVLHCTMTA